MLINQPPNGKKWRAYYFCGACGTFLGPVDDGFMGIPTCCPVCGHTPEYKEYRVMRGYWSKMCRRGLFVPHPDDKESYALIMARRSISRSLGGKQNGDHKTNERNG